MVVEMVALLVLAGTAAGRWCGLDFFLYRMFGGGRRTFMASDPMGNPL